MLSSKQRAFLRSLSNSLDPVFQVGKGGISENLAKTVSDALEARELIKLRVLDNSGYTAREAAEIAKRAEVKRLLLGHYSSRYDDEKQLLNEAREIFPDCICADEGLVVNI